MKHQITNNKGNTCVISLIPETSIEESLLKTSKDENTFLFHYIEAIKSQVNPAAELISLLEYSRFPSPVTVQYQIAKGLGH